ncbi:MAG: RDD family protein [Actinomycetes bacterium]
MTNDAAADGTAADHPAEADDGAEESAAGDRGWFLQRAVTGAMDATMGRVEDRVAATTKTVIDDVEPYLTTETIPRVVDALVPHLIERIVPEIIDGITDRLASDTAPAVVRGMTPQLADDLVPALVDRMRPYLETELVPAIVDELTPYIIEQTAPRIIDGVMPYIRAQVIPQVMDDFVEDPRVRDLIREQSLGLLWDGLEVLRHGLAKADDIADAIVRRIFFQGPPKEGYPPGDLLPGRDRSHAGIITRATAMAIDVGLISLIAAQGLATVVSLLGAVIDPIPTWLAAGLTFVFAMLGPLYLALTWRTMGRSVGGAIAGFADVRVDGSRIGIIRGFIRALISLFALPFWALGLIGCPFHPLRRSWVDRLLDTRTPYMVHREHQLLITLEH